jgi:hypothetical protein
MWQHKCLAKLRLLDEATNMIEDLEEVEDAKRTKRKWCQEWLVRDGHSESIFHQIASSDPKKFFNSFRMSQETFEQLLTSIQSRIERKDTKMRMSIPARTRLQITLRFLASGSSYKILEEMFCISSTTISQIVPDVCTAIWEELGKSYIKCPNSEDEWKCVAQGFHRWDYPRALGALDGKHISIDNFGNSGSAFRNYKQGFSIVLLALVDSNYAFLFTDIGTGGASNDSGIFNKSAFNAALISGALNLPSISEDDPLQVQYHFLADDAFGLSQRLMKPYPLRNLDPVQRVFNYRFSRTRRVVENAFGILSARFRVFRQPIRQNYQNAIKTVQAAVVLHNYILKECGLTVPPVEYSGKSFMDSLPMQAGNRTGTSNARAQRDRLAKHFSEEGAVGFQWEQTFRKK